MDEEQQAASDIQPQPTVDSLSQRRVRQRQAVLDVLSSHQNQLSKKVPFRPASIIGDPTHQLPSRTKHRFALTKLFHRTKTSQPLKEVIKRPEINKVVIHKSTGLVVSPHHKIHNWPVIILLSLLICALAAWLAIYRLGADGPIVQAAAKILPLAAGRVGSHEIYLRDLFFQSQASDYSAPSLKRLILPLNAQDNRSVFLSLADKLLVRDELNRLGVSVSQTNVDSAVNLLLKQFSGTQEFNDWVKSNYNTDIVYFKENIIQPWLERQRLAVILVSNQILYADQWSAAKKESVKNGTYGMEDMGWVTAADLSGSVADIVAGLNVNVRTQPFVTQDGLMVMMVTEKLRDDTNTMHWHLWRKLISVPAVNDYLTQARQTTEIKYFLP